MDEEGGLFMEDVGDGYLADIESSSSSSSEDEGEEIDNNNAPENDSDDDNEDVGLAQLHAEFPDAASNALQAVRRHRLRGSLVEEILSTMDEAKLELYRESGITLDIPSVLLDQLMVRADAWLLRTPRYLGLCVTPSTRTLVICCAEERPMAHGYWTSEDLDQLVQRIIATCKYSLVKLTIYNGVYNDNQLNMSTEQLNILLNGIENLQQLQVEAICEDPETLSIIVTDSTMDIIAQKHKKIRTLSVPSSVTLAGLQRVLDSCKDLEHLSMDNSEEANKAAILQIPTLKSISSFPLGICVCEIAMERDPEEPPFPLRAVVFAQGNPEEFKQILKVFPNVGFIFPEIDDLGYYEALMEHRTELYSLELIYNPVPTPVAEFMQHFSTSLTSLTIDDSYLVADLAVIGYFCTSLKKLLVKAKLAADPGYTSMLEPRHFAALESLRVVDFRDPSHQLPHLLLLRLFGGEHLRSLDWCASSVPDAVAMELEEEAMVEGKALSTLQLLTLERSDSLSNAFLRIIQNAPNLLALYTCGTFPPSIHAFLAQVKPNLLIIENIEYGVPTNPMVPYYNIW